MQAVSWSNDRGGSGVAIGTTAWSIAALPLQPGVNVITVVATDTQGLSASAALSVMRTGTALTYVLAEGATGSFFQTELALANPTAVPAPVQISVLEGSRRNRDADAYAGRHVAPDDLPSRRSPAWSRRHSPLSSRSTERCAARRRTNDGVGRERVRRAHREAVTGPASTWYFAEGAQGFFYTYCCSQIQQPRRMTARSAGCANGARSSRASRLASVAADHRHRRGAGAGRSLVRHRGDVRAPGVAERAMYFGDSPLCGRPRIRGRDGAGDGVVPRRRRHRSVLRHVHPLVEPERTP